jgi:hypothetical protein
VSSLAGLASLWPWLNVVRRLPTLYKLVCVHFSCFKEKTIRPIQMSLCTRLGESRGGQEISERERSGKEGAPSRIEGQLGSVKEGGKAEDSPKTSTRLIPKRRER